MKSDKIVLSDLKIILNVMCKRVRITQYTCVHIYNNIFDFILSNKFKFMDFISSYNILHRIRKCTI